MEGTDLFTTEIWRIQNGNCNRCYRSKNTVAHQFVSYEESIYSNQTAMDIAIMCGQKIKLKRLRGNNTIIIRKGIEDGEHEELKSLATSVLDDPKG